MPGTQDQPPQERVDPGVEVFGQSNGHRERERVRAGCLSPLRAVGKMSLPRLSHTTRSVSFAAQVLRVQNAHFHRQQSVA